MNRDKLQCACKMWALVAALGYALNHIFLRVALSGYDLHNTVGSTLQAVPTLLLTLVVGWGIRRRDKGHLSPWADHREFMDLAPQCPDLPLDLVATRDHEVERLAAKRQLKDVFPWFLSFDRLIRETDFVERMRQMLSILGEAYGHPVDIEFSASFRSEELYRINLLQCRPMRAKTDAIAVEPPVELSDLIDSWQQGYALIVTSSALTVGDPPCIAATAVPPNPVGCVGQVSVDFASFCGTGAPECPVCTPTWYEWDFGDGSFDSGADKDTTQHIYTTGGLACIE